MFSGIDFKFRKSAECLEMHWPKKKRRNIYPIFLPFWGCPQRCVFCAQDMQTGCKNARNMDYLQIILHKCAADLNHASALGIPPGEVAFYGGTFTGLPEAAWEMCLDFVRGALADNLIAGFRCSTRPDALKPDRLRELSESGCLLVELGIQSFHDESLSRSGRGISGIACQEALASLSRHNLPAGVQLMPGMPGSTPDIFLNDVRVALSLGAECLRFYPCLVLRETKLADLWANGLYKPWDLCVTVENLAKGWLMATSANVDVIRMGLAPETGLESAILAGPRHPSLGGMVLGRALLYACRAMLARMPEKPYSMRLLVPRHAQGHIWGWQSELRAEWLKLNLAKISFTDGNELVLKKVRSHLSMGK